MNNNPVWPGWETVRLIGRGSFGTVYEIQRDVLGDVEKAALKVISLPQNSLDIDEMYNDGYDDESITSTFQSHLKSIVAEYSLMRKMNGHSNIVSCDDIRYIQHEDGFGWDIFIKMELLTPLSKTLPTKIPEETVRQVATDMCAALEVCQKHSIVHRDIKPQNIFLSPNGDYKLGDFGIAKTVEKTMGGTKTGTYKYMSPEVYNNQPYGTTADIYSLGLVLYWMLNEKRMPFLPLPPAKLGADMEAEARLRRFNGEQLPPPAHGSKQLQNIVLKACAYDPKERYQSAAEMLAALNGYYFSKVDRKQKELEEQEQLRREKEQQERIRKEQETREHLRKEQEHLQRTHEEQQEPAHNKKKKPFLLWAAIALMPLLLILCLLTTLHDATTATCTDPSVCKICGKILSPAWGHHWTEESGGTSRKCLVCGITEGSHQETAYPDTPANPSVVQEVNLSVWINPGEDEWITQQADAFVALHPEYNITLSVEYCAPGDSSFLIQRGMASAPDIFFFSSDGLDTLVDLACLSRLEGTVRSQIDSTFPDIHINCVTHENGGIYGFPMESDTWFLYYDKSIFSEEDIRSLDKMLQKGRVAFPTNNTWYLASFFIANGGTMFGDSGKDSSVGIQFGPQNGGVDTAKKLVQLCNHQNFYTQDDAISLMSSNSVDAVFSGAWDYSSLKNILGNNLGCAQLPTVTINGYDRQLYSFSIGYCLGVNPNASHYQVALEFAEFLSSADSQLLRYQLHGAIPANTDLLLTPGIPNPELTTAIANTLTNTAIMQPAVPGMNNYWTHMQTFATALTDGTISENNAADYIDRLMAGLNP